MDSFLELVTSENFVIMNFIFEIILLIIVVISLYFLVKASIFIASIVTPPPYTA